MGKRFSRAGFTDHCFDAVLLTPNFFSFFVFVTFVFFAVRTSVGDKATIKPHPFTENPIAPLVENYTTDILALLVATTPKHQTR